MIYEKKCQREKILDVSNTAKLIKNDLKDTICSRK